jgi:hypothetical protein
MLYNSFLKEGVVYVPTVVKLQTGAYMDTEPVTVVPVASTEGLRLALLGVIAKGNAVVPNAPKDNWPPPVLLKYTRAKTWSAFKRGASHWHIQDKDGNYQIVGYRTHLKGYWEEDPDQIIKFAAGSTIDEVIERMITILQDAARQQSN